MIQPPDASAIDKIKDDPFASIRARRTRLQAALLEKIPSGIIQFSKKLVSLEDLGENKGVHLVFKDGTETTADLVLGADGIRSVGLPLCDTWLALLLTVSIDCSADFVSRSPSTRYRYISKHVFV